MFRKASWLLLVAALALPITLVVLVGLARLLEGMGDAAGARLVHGLALAGGVAWLLSLIFLVILQALAQHVDLERIEADEE